MPTILYKFRSAIQFESLAVPSMRLFDIKCAIVKAKRLDNRQSPRGRRSHLAFDMSVHNETTNEEYCDDEMLLPRGVRIIVRRHPVPHGELGLLEKMAAGLSQSLQSSSPSRVNNHDEFFTIDCQNRDREEFVNNSVNDGVVGDDSVGGKPEEQKQAKEEEELGKLMKVINRGPQVEIDTFSHPKKLPTRQIKKNSKTFTKYSKSVSRPKYENPDPELRGLEEKSPKKKRGLPMIFLSSVGDKSSSKSPDIQPNKAVFDDLVMRGGGQSESSLGTRRSNLGLDYALKITAMSIPDHLKCGICHSIVKDAVLLPWDPQIQTTACGGCIRASLVQNGFCCPLTGVEGVSPDDVFPNPGLSKAAESFVQTVFETMDQIEQNGDVEEKSGMEPQYPQRDETALETCDNIDSVRGESNKQETNQRPENNDFEVEFGGDVFDVVPVNEEIVEKDSAMNQHGSVASNLKPMETKSTELVVDDIAKQMDKEKIVGSDVGSEGLSSTQKSNSSSSKQHSKELSSQWSPSSPLKRKENENIHTAMINSASSMQQQHQKRMKISKDHHRGRHALPPPPTTTKRHCADHPWGFNNRGSAMNNSSSFYSSSSSSRFSPRPTGRGGRGSSSSFRNKKQQSFHRSSSPVRDRPYLYNNGNNYGFHSSRNGRPSRPYGYASSYHASPIMMTNPK